MAKKPADRYPSCTAFAEATAEVLFEHQRATPVPAPPAIQAAPVPESSGAAEAEVVATRAVLGTVVLTFAIAGGIGSVLYSLNRVENTNSNDLRGHAIWTFVGLMLLASSAFAISSALARRQLAKQALEASTRAAPLRHLLLWMTAIGMLAAPITGLILAITTTPYADIYPESNVPLLHVASNYLPKGFWPLLDLAIVAIVAGCVATPLVITTPNIRQDSTRP
ncbi:hypothetical protein [Nocardia sp. NPDC052566]|uniref:hypothetical protein n=1 Tax=Nocardia sp. NPDC052566 TaxID=3364330 RepID=UPI0037C530D0